jgi:sugar lactone lactonase YvrE
MSAAPSARILDETSCRLGEGPSYEAESDALFWFDILDRKLLEHSFKSGKTWVHDLPFMASAIFSVDADRQMILSEQGLHIRNRASGALSLHAAVEVDNKITRSNDARAHPCGAIWFGTMGIDEETGAGSIYHFFKGQVRVLYPGITIPNSICFSPDGATAYFVDTPTHQLMRVAIDPKTALPVGGPQLFYAHQGAGWIDGSVCDAPGNVWNARWGAGEVVCLSPEGREISNINVPLSPQTSCPAFVGQNADRLIVTSAHKLMSDAARAAAPAAGKTFIADLKVSGRLEPKVLI